MTRLAFYHCHNPNHARYGELVHVAGARWPIEECFGSAKNEVGLDDYQVRTWDAWHRHITLAMLAHTFLAVMAWHTQPKMALVTLPWAPTRSGRTGASRLPVGAPSTAQQNRSSAATSGP
jgi:hypothetical protein